MMKSRKRSVGVLLVVVLAILLFVGPRETVGELTADAVDRLPDDLGAWPAWFASRERAAGVTDTAVAARVLFADGPTRRAWSVVYLHGFSATRQETAPLAEEVARQLGANLFETRLRGHGLPGDSMGVVAASDWLRDARLAFEAGRRLGDSVLVIGTSTGATLAAWLGTRAPSERSGLAALVFISPNFGPKDKMARMLTWPWTKQLLPLIDADREWTPRNALQARYWTTRYPSTGVFPMQALVEHVRAQSLDAYDTPTLVIFNPNDNVVDVARIAAWTNILTSTTRTRFQQLQVLPPGDEDQHVLAGRILAPDRTGPIRDSIVAFVRR